MRKPKLRLNDYYIGETENKVWDTDFCFLVFKKLLNEQLNYGVINGA